MTALVEPSGRQATAPLDEMQREAVDAYCRIAAASGGLLSLEDLVDLLAIDAAVEEVEERIASDGWLASRVFVESGHVLMRHPGSDRAGAGEAMREERRRRRRAVANLERARAFTGPLSKDAIFVAVAGTNSYLSAAEDDDIDLYCITKTNGMWAFMLKSFILARIYSLARKPAAPFCFSFVMDERRARDELSRPQDALFARDTLTAKVISDAGAYYPILEGASWMRNYFPSLYERKMREAGSPKGTNLRAGKGSRIMNSWLFLTLGSYVSLKAWAQNRRLAKEGRSDDIFRTNIGPGHLEFVSRKYVELGKMYRGLRSGRRNALS